MDKLAKVDEIPFPKEGQFLAAWLSDAEVDCIELYMWQHGNSFYNLNSGNMNTLGGMGNMAMFTHWCDVPNIME